ncbi:MAG: hypothetical protein QF663_05820 [Verrucomicrobiota bacterium]|nr:hypothetical protein [Verrucomicrobiota bacterium]
MAGKKRISEETPHSGDDRGWRLAQLAVGLIREKLIVAKDSDGRIIHELNNETQISMALEAASYLLDAAERHSYFQYAYQLFDDEYLSINAIAVRFKSADWKGLTSPQAVEEILKPILRRLKDFEALPLLGPHTPESPLAHLPHSSVGTTLEALWMPVEKLEVNSDGTKRGKRYFVRRIILLAKLLFSEDFPRLRRPYPLKPQKNS